MTRRIINRAIVEEPVRDEPGENETLAVRSILNLPPGVSQYECVPRAPIDLQKCRAEFILESRCGGPNSRRSWRCTVSRRRERIADPNLIGDELSMLEVFGIQDFTSGEQRRRGNQCVIKRKSIAYGNRDGATVRLNRGNDNFEEILSKGSGAWAV